MKPHSFTKFIKYHGKPRWYYCVYCGLVLLRNKATEQAIREGCKWADKE